MTMNGSEALDETRKNMQNNAKHLKSINKYKC